jgi:phosphoadenosine phosphosulfate reductase
MQPIFSEYIAFLKDNGIDIGLREGYLWQNRLYIEGFDKNGKMQNFGRLHVDDDFKITYKQKKSINYDKLMSWDDLVQFNIDRLKQLEADSIEAVKYLLDQYADYNKYICHSGGKDSTVLTNIVRSVDPTIQIMFNNTSNESADTYKFIKSFDNVWIVNPKEGFWQWIKRSNFVPSQHSRGCCAKFKHELTTKNLDTHKEYLLFMDVRNSESKTRADYTTEYRYSYYPENWMAGLPIRQWDELDIWLYIFYQNLNFNPMYRYGYKRCGCVVCPFLTHLEDALNRYWFPKTIERWNQLLIDYFTSKELWIALHCTLQQFLNGGWKLGVFTNEPSDKVIQEFAEYKGLDYQVAQRFFNHTCIECGKKINRSQVIAMNLKLNGRQTNIFYCKKCLKKQYGMDENTWNKYVEDFKRQGCDLF